MPVPEVPLEKMIFNQPLTVEEVIAQLIDAFEIDEGLQRVVTEIFRGTNSLWKVRFELLIPGKGDESPDVINICIFYPSDEAPLFEAHTLYPFYSEFHKRSQLQTWPTLVGALTPEEEKEFFQILILNWNRMGLHPNLRMNVTKEFECRRRQLRAIKMGLLTRDEVSMLKNRIDFSTYPFEPAPIRYLVDQAMSHTRISFEEWLKCNSFLDNDLIGR